MSTKWILSATQIETFLLCKRKWAYKYLEGKKPPITKAQELGSEVHQYLFNYLSNNVQLETSNLGQIVKPGLGFLPKSLPKENLESHFAYDKDGHIFHGYIDFYDHLGNHKYLVGDHKTSSNLSRILTREDLKKDIQANIYAQYFFSQKDAQSIDLRWVYYRTKGSPKAVVVEAALSKDEAEQNFKPIKAAADEIVKIIKYKPNDFGHQNRSACFIMGKCSFFDLCRSPMEVKLPKTEGFHLYLDCLPVRNNYQKTILLSELLKPVLEKINHEKNLRHYRLAGYGQHVGLIADYLSEHLREKPLNNKTAVLSNTKTPEGIDTLETLSAVASQITRGL